MGPRTFGFCRWPWNTGLVINSLSPELPSALARREPVGRVHSLRF